MNPFSRAVALAVLLLVLCGDPSYACRRRGPCGPPPCVPCDDCCVYRASFPVVPIDGPFPTLVRGAALGSGLIVQFEVPFGSPPFPTDDIAVQMTGNGLMRYVGWNKRTVTPGLPGSPTLYSIFLCPVRIGDCHVAVRLSFSNGTSKTVPYAFHVR
jgi:hypothetical protein